MQHPCTKVSRRTFLGGTAALAASSLVSGRISAAPADRPNSKIHGVSWIHVPAKDFAFTRGKPKIFKSSSIAERSFCGRCGCQFTFRFLGEADHDTGSLWLSLGSTDRADDFEFTHHIFTAEQLPWLNLDDGLKRWPGQLPWLRSDDSLTRR